MRDKLVRFLATGVYTGYLPVSGTFGTMVGWAVYMALRHNTLLFASWIAVGIAGGAYVCTLAEQLFREKDSHKIVLDEVVGYWVTMFLLPFDPGYAIAGFFLFRLFDVWKPWIINSVQSWPGGWGIMMDDILAGLLSNIVLQVFRILH